MYVIHAHCGAIHFTRTCQSRDELDRWIDVLSERNYVIDSIDIGEAW